jgi:DNA (cytosine-5)-methyltransferase 1
MVKDGIPARSPEGGARVESPSFIDLFAGCGGLSLGLMKAGWRGVLAVERDPHAFATLRHNLIDRQARDGNVFDWPEWLPREPMSVQVFAHQYEEEIRSSLRGKVQLVAGGPPCQGFSFAGARNAHDPRNRLFRAYVEVVKQVSPELVLIENVQGITVEFGRAERRRSPPRAGRPREPYSLKIQRALERLGYSIVQEPVLTAEYGVPQRRTRHLLIGVKADLGRKATSDPFALLRAERGQFLTARGLGARSFTNVQSAISDLLKAHGTYKLLDSPRFEHGVSTGASTPYQRLLTDKTQHHRPDSHRFANHRKEIIERFSHIIASGRRGVKIREETLLELGTKKKSLIVLDPSEPSPTITTVPDDILHYSEPRILTVRESARLQSFPDWFEFKGKYTTGGLLRRREVPRYSQVGNAVPPLLGEAVGRSLLRLLNPRTVDVALGSVPAVVLHANAVGQKQVNPLAG